MTLPPSSCARSYSRRTWCRASRAAVQLVEPRGHAREQGVAERADLSEQLAERVAGDRHQGGRRGRGHCRVAWSRVEERELAEVVAGSERGDGLAIPAHQHATGGDDEE